MDLADRLSQGKQEIVREWIRITMEAYPEEALNVFKRNKDQFANPLPHIISKNITLLFDELLNGVSSETTIPILSEIVRLKAVQDFGPSDAVNFVFGLKKVVRKYLEDQKGERIDADLHLAFEDEIDDLASMAFDIYVSCREKLFEIRVNEIRNQTHMLIRRVNEMDKQKKEAR